MTGSNSKYGELLKVTPKAGLCSEKFTIVVSPEPLWLIQLEFVKVSREPLPPSLPPSSLSLITLGDPSSFTRRIPTHTRPVGLLLLPPPTHITSPQRLTIIYLHVRPPASLRSPPWQRPNGSHSTALGQGGPPPSQAPGFVSRLC